MAWEMDLEATGQAWISRHTGFNRLDVIFIEAIETGDTFYRGIEAGA